MLGKVKANLVRTAGKDSRSELCKEAVQRFTATSWGAGGCFWGKAPARAHIGLSLLIPAVIWTPLQQRDLRPDCFTLGRGGNTTGLTDKVSMCWVMCDAVVPNFPACLDLVWIPHSWLPCPSTQLLPSPAFPGIIQRWGKNYMEGFENLKCLSKAWVDVSLAVQKS